MAKVINIYGGTTWLQHSGYFLRGATSGVVANSATKTGGEDTHTLTINEMPSHTHSTSEYGYSTGSFTAGGYSYILYGQSHPNTGATGGNGAHNNIPNYKSVYIWERTA